MGLFSAFLGGGVGAPVVGGFLGTPRAPFVPSTPNGAYAGSPTTTILGRKPQGTTPAGRIGTTGAAPNPLDRDYIGSQLDALYARYGATPGARGSGPTDREYYIDEIARSGGWMNGGPTSDNIGYWSDKIGQDLTRAGYQLQPTSTGTGATPTPADGRRDPTPGAPEQGVPRNPNDPNAGQEPGRRSPPIPGKFTPIPGKDPTHIPAATGPTAQIGSPNEIASRQRKKQTGPGRTQTILGGFGSGAPATRAATLLGKY